MITVFSTTKNTGRNAMIHTTFFYIPVNFAFNIPHHVTSYMHRASKKESEKEILKKEKNKPTKNFLRRDLNPDPQNQLELKFNTFIH